MRSSASTNNNILGVREKGSDVPKQCMSHGRKQKADTYHQNMCPVKQVRNTRPDTVTREVMYPVLLLVETK
jgi:hypothetical protein